MNTRLVLGASAVLMGLAGAAAIFAPHEILAALEAAPGEILAILVQMLGALLFAFAMVNWTARGSLIGGIYNRPVAIGNLSHFVIGALALVRAAGSHAAIATAALTYVIFAIVFGALLFRSPVEKKS